MVSGRPGPADGLSRVRLVRPAGGWTGEQTGKQAGRRAGNRMEWCRKPLQREPDKTRVRRQLKIAERVIVDLRHIVSAAVVITTTSPLSSGETGVCGWQVMRWWKAGALLRCCLHTLGHTHRERAGEGEEENGEEKNITKSKHNPVSAAPWHVTYYNVNKFMLSIICWHKKWQLHITHSYTRYTAK